MTHPQPCILSGNYLRKKWISSGYQNMNRRLIRSKKANQSCVSMTPSPATPTEGQVAHPVTIASPSTSPEKVPTETTSPVELPVTTPQAPKRRVLEREKKKTKGNKFSRPGHMRKSILKCFSIDKVIFKEVKCFLTTPKTTECITSKTQCLR